MINNNQPSFEETVSVAETTDTQLPSFEDTIPVNNVPSYEDTVPVNAKSKTESALRGAAQGISLGFADEVVGTVEGAYKTLSKKLEGTEANFAEEYTKARDESRLEFKEAEEQNPAVFKTSEIVTSIAPTIATGGAGLAANVGRRVALGAAQGVTQALGQSEAEELKELILDGVKGAVVGSLAGGITQAGAAGARGVGKILEPAAETVPSSKAMELLKSGAKSILAVVTKGASVAAEETAKRFGPKTATVLEKVLSNNITKLAAIPVASSQLTKPLLDKSTSDDLRLFLKGELASDTLDPLDSASNGVVETEQSITNSTIDALRDAIKKKDKIKIQQLGTVATLIYGPDLTVEMLEAPDKAKQRTIREEALGSPELVGETLLADKSISNLFNGVNNSNIADASNKIIGIEKSMSNVDKKLKSQSAESEDGLTSLVGKGSVKDQYKRMLEKVSQFNSNPEVMSNKVAELAPGISEQAPRVSDQYTLGLVQAVKYIDEIIPKPSASSSSLLRQREYLPSDQEMSKFKNQLDIIVNPTSAISKLSKGTLNKEQVKVLENLYPNLLDVMRQRVIKNLETRENVSYGERVKLSLLLGMPTDYSVVPSSIQQLQSNFNQQPEQQQSQAPRPAGFKVSSVAGGTSELLKSNKS